jgi:hypothetical protein
MGVDVENVICCFWVGLGRCGCSYGSGSQCCKYFDEDYKIIIKSVTYDTVVSPLRYRTNLIG